MAGFLVIGDEATCAGFRLAGVETRVPGEAEEAAVFAAALREAAVVVLTAGIAERLPEAALAAARTATAPAVLVIPDLRERRAPPSLGIEIRRTLGIEA